MPSRNVIKPNVADAYYHIYARGASKAKIFHDDSDYDFFISLFARYLSVKQKVSRLSVYPHLRGEIELLCYCLMSNHIHLMIYQIEQSGMSRLMRSVMTSYSRYFNHKYKQTGALFESRYKASLVDTDTYLMQLSRYIHLNPKNYKSYVYSSYQYFIKPEKTPEWLQTQKLCDLFTSPSSYAEFVADYEDVKDELAQLKKQIN